MATSVRKYSVLLLLAVFSLSSLITVQAYSVDSITKPSVPEFTVRIASYPYDVPSKTTTTIDEYTGKETTTTQPGYNVENKSIEIIIKNQPFTPYNLTKYTVYYRDRDDFSHITGSETFDESKTVNFYYNIEVKGHFGDNWYPVETKYSYFEGPEPKAQLNSPYTVISVGHNYPEDVVLDFRAQARIGYFNSYGPAVQVIGYDFYGQESDWSNIQTLNISTASVSVSPSPTVPSTLPSQNSSSTEDQSGNTEVPNADLTVIAVAAIVLITAITLFAIGVIQLRRKNR